MQPQRLLRSHAHCAGETGARWIALAITISALGFLSQSMLTAPRVYYAMARDGLFFASVGKLFGKSEAPVVAILLQGFAAIVIACSGTYGEILNFEVTVDFIFFGMTATSLFIFTTAADRIAHSYLPRTWFIRSRRCCLCYRAQQLF